ncbi:hypothetical protein Tco_0637581 [Tanacetum coccineum]
MLCYRLGVPLFYVSKPRSACSKVFTRDIYGDHDVSCDGVIGIKHRHNVVRDTLVDICLRSGISAGKEVDIGGGSSPLTQSGMADFMPGRAVIDAAQRKRGKYTAKCAAIEYGFLPFSFSSLGELEANAVSLLKRIRKDSMAQDIGARADIHIFNRISFAIAKGGLFGKKDDILRNGSDIGKTRMQKLQREGLLESINDGSYDKCKSYVCGPFRHVSRKGASYFLTFTDDQSLWYGVARRCENETPADKLHRRSVKYGDFLERDLISQEFSGRNYDLEDYHMDTLPSENTAMLDPDKVIWQGAMDEEMNSMKVNEVWIEVDPPPNAKIVRSKWLFKKKTDMHGEVHTYKARLNGRLDEGHLYGEPEGRIYHVSLLDAQGQNVAFAQNMVSSISTKSGKSPTGLLVRCDASCHVIKMIPSPQTGYVFVVNEGAVDWKSKKQTTIAMSATQSEYMAASEAAMEAIWIRKFVGDLGVMPSIKEPI